MLNSALQALAEEGVLHRKWGASSPHSHSSWAPVSPPGSLHGSTPGHVWATCLCTCSCLQSMNRQDPRLPCNCLSTVTSCCPLVHGNYTSLWIYTGPALSSHLLTHYTGSSLPTISRFHHPGKPDTATLIRKLTPTRKAKYIVNHRSPVEIPR